MASASMSAFLYKPAFLFRVKHVVFLIHAPCETILHAGSVLWVLGAKLHDGPANKSPNSQPVYEGCDMPNLMAAQVLLICLSFFPNSSHSQL